MYHLNVHNAYFFCLSLYSNLAMLIRLRSKETHWANKIKRCFKGLTSLVSP